jgi:hypothetical protein
LQVLNSPYLETHGCAGTFRKGIRATSFEALEALLQSMNDRLREAVSTFRGNLVGKLFGSGLF